MKDQKNISAVNTTAMSYQLTGLDPQQNYTIQVRTYTSVGPSASRMVECTPLEISKKMNFLCMLRICVCMCVCVCVCVCVGGWETCS